MNKKLKELIEDIKYGIETGKDKETNIEIDGYCLSWKNCKIILDYITNLQEKLEVAQDNEESYRLEMQDITKCLDLDKHTLFDDVKDYATNLQEELEEEKRINQEDLKLIDELQQENERLKKRLTTKKLFKKYKVQTSENFEIRKIFELQERIEKAVEYIKQQTTDEETGKDLGYSDNIDYEYLLNILNGGNNE